MTALLVAVVAASLLGSLHCAGMCGAFAAIAVSRGRGAAAADGAAPSGGALLQGAYHGGRLVGYAAFGAAAGSAGALLDLSGVLAGLSSFAAVLAGATLVLLGGFELARHLGARLGAKRSLPRPAFVNALVRRALRTDRPAARALAMGAASALLPCGWLYAFVVTAAGTGHPLSGAAVMAAFWVGTVPILFAVGFGADRLRGLFGQRLAVVGSAAVLLLGVLTLVGRVELDAAELAGRVEAAAVATSSDGDVPDAGATPACCSGH